MLGDPFYHQTIRKLTVGFATLFNNIFIVRKNDSSKEVERILVPISYGPKEKWIHRFTSDINKPIQMVLPRMSYELGGVMYDANRKLQTMHKIKKFGTTTHKWQYMPIPYDLAMNLHIISKNASDGQQIVEQILPYFQPDFAITINLLPEMGYTIDVPIVLSQPINLSDDYTGDFKQRRDMIWTLNFVIKGWMFGPVHNQGIIRKVQVDLLIPPGSGEVTDEDIYSTPRKTRILVTPDPLDANPADNWDYNVTIQEYDDGYKFNPHTLEDEPVGNTGVYIENRDLIITTFPPTAIVTEN